MNRIHLALVGLVCAFFPQSSPAQESISDVFADPALDFDRPVDRARSVQRIRAIEMANRDRAHAKARAMGLPIRQVLPNGTVTEIMGLDENGEFLIYTTHNANAAISSAANLVYPAPYSLDGTGITVGVWDESAVRVTHTEFLNQAGTASRVTVRDGATTLSSHATHVAGTVNARGASATRKGMAPNALVDSYNWSSDITEMTAAGASSPQEIGKINISNHSYGFATGWRWNGSNWQWGGTGTDQNAYASQFGQYTTQARDWDSLAFNTPYYLIFKSAGNDNSNNPANGATVIISGNSVIYDNTIHPPGNGLYRNTTTNSANGYENISHGGNAKNIMTMGAANDAVTSGLRDPAKSTLTSFSSRGPTDDGRIKPDIVANGASLSSTESSGDTAYSSKSGTSMSSPSAAGSAALLVQLYRNLFPGGDMRASTLKGLILHTATDIGNPGPDYHYGWGLMDTKKAADLIIDHHANPEKSRMLEETLSAAVPSQTYTFTWDGVSPIRATLCWTDPAAASTTTHDLRSSRLVNDLDLKIIAPDGTQHYPYVMPYVGTWTVASMSENATTGINSTDNVEQVLIQNPGQSGTWQVVIDHKGNLTNNQQIFSLVTTGLSAAPLSMEVARGGSPIGVGTADGVSGTAVGSGTQLSYTISNVGGGQLELTTPVTISGQQNCSVTVNTQPSSLVDGGDSTSLITTVTPAAGGTWSFNISIANNDPEKSPYHWFVTGIAGSSGSVSFTPVADTYIYDQSTGTNYGTEPSINLNNRTNGNAASLAVLRGLLRFDLSTIPPGTTIESAMLDFVQDNGNSGSVDIVEAISTWGETTATWANSNGIYGATSFGTATTGTTAGAAVPTITLNPAGLTKVQSWVNSPSGNHGFGITTTNNGNGQAAWLALRSRDHPTSAHHPRLTVTYGGGGAVEAPLMIVSGSDGVISNGGTESIPGTLAGGGTQLTYSIANLGNANLTMTTPVTTTVGSNCSITVNTQPSSPVAPSGSTDLVLTITPSSAGAWSATVSIANNDADKNPYTWTISGSAFGSHTLTYNGNNADSGSAPVDASNPYFEGATVTVLGNPGSLIKAGSSFAGWNTAANGTGTTYAPGATFSMPGANVTLYAVWNALPVVNAGADQNIFLAASAWTPLTLNPGLWLDAADDATVTLNGATVSQWDDKSTFNRHATATGTAQPTATAAGLNGKRVLTFDGSTDVLNVDLDFLAGVSHSAFIVTHPNMLSNIYGAANASQGANSLHVGFNGSNYRMNYWANDFGPTRSANFVAGSANLVNFIWNTGVGKEIMANGKSEGTNTNAGVIGTMSGGGRIGRTTGHPYFGGDIAEIIIIPGTLSAQSRQEVEGYLAHKWGLAANLPNDHPYKASPPDGAAATTTLAGSASDPENDALATQWTQVGGPAAPSFQDDTATNSDVTFMQEGIYTLRLTAADEFGSAFDEVTITVGPPTEVRSLTYSGNGNTSGDAPVDPQSPYADSATVTVLDAGTLAKTGHTFAGWNTGAGGSGTPYAPDATFTINANTTLHAQWTPNTYTVTFDPNGGSAPVPTSKQVTFDATYGTLATTTRAGHTFIGWFTAASGGTEVTEATMVSTANNHTLYAQWMLTPVSAITDVNTVNIPEGGSETFQVKLSDQPAETVTVTVARASGDTDISVQSGGSLNFTTANWDTYQTVTLAAAIDADAANGTAIITCTPSDPAYQAAEVTAIEIDKDTLLTVASDGNGTTTPSGAVVVEKGVATAILANPSVSHNFVNWTVTSGSATLGNANSASTTVTLSEPATVQANFTIKQYTLSYSAPSGGSIFGDSPQFVNHGSDGTQVTAAPDPGYSFVKWSDNVQTESRTDTAVTSDLTVTAEFAPNTYTVTFNPNGGDAPVPATKEVDFNAAYGTLATTTRSGHTFDGWFTAAEGGDEVTAESLVVIDADHTLHAQWTANTYTVTFDPNGGDTPVPTTKEITFGSAYGTLASASRTGYTLEGWFTAASEGIQVTDATTVTTAANHTLYAQWSLVVVSVITDQDTVNIPEGGTETFQVKLSDQPAESVTVTVARSSGDTDITVQSGNSLLFTTANWDTYQTVTLAAANDADADNGTATITCAPSNPAYTAKEVTAIEIDKDTTLTVASDGNGITDPSGAVVVEKGAATAISATANEGYDFVNWTVTSGAATLADATAASTTATISDATTVQANFAIRQYTLTYAAGPGGSITGTSPQTVNHGANGSQVTAVPNTGYSFARWSDDVLTASRTDAAVTSSITVTAEFSVNTYDVVFDANGGTTAEPASKQVTFGATYGTLATTTRPGYFLDGWFTAASGGNRVLSGTTVTTASNHTLYARWIVAPGLIWANSYFTLLDVSSPTTVNSSRNFPSFLDGPLTGSSNLTHTGFFQGQSSFVNNAGDTFNGNIIVDSGTLRIAGGPFDSTGGFVAGSMTSANTLTINRAGVLTIDDNVTGGYTANRFGAVGERQAIDLAGGNINLLGLNNATSSVQTFGALTSSSGQGSINVTRNSNGNPNLTFDSLAVNSGSFLTFNGTNLGTGTNDARITITTAPTMINGIIAGARFATNSGDTNSTFVTYGADGVRAFTASDFTIYAANDINGATSTQNAQMTGAFAPVELTSDVAVNSLNYNGNGGTWSLGGNKLTLTSGMLLRNGTNAAVTIDNGTLTAGNGTDAIDLNITTAQQNMGIHAVIADNGASAVTLVKSGDTRNLSLSGSADNTYTGGTYVVGGNLSTGNVANRSYLGSGKVVVDGASILTLGNVGATSNATGDDYTAINSGQINIASGANGAYTAADTFNIGANSIISGGSASGQGLASLTRGTNITLAADSIIGHNQLTAALNLTTGTIQNLGTSADLYFGVNSQGNAGGSIEIGNGTAFKGISGLRAGNMNWSQGTINVATGTSEVDFQSMGGLALQAPDVFNLGNGATAGGIVISLADAGTLDINLSGRFNLTETQAAFGDTSTGRNVRLVVTAGSDLGVGSAAGMGGGTGIASALVQNGGFIRVSQGVTATDTFNGAVTVEAGGQLTASLAGGLTGVGQLTFNEGSLLNITNATGFSGSQADAASIAAGTIVRLSAGNFGTAGTTLDSVLGSGSNNQSYLVVGQQAVNPTAPDTAVYTLNKSAGGVGGVMTNDIANRAVNNLANGHIALGANGGGIAATTGTTFTISENITGAGSLTAGTSAIIDGAPKLGTVSLNTANDYSGGTIVDAGTLTMGNAAALGSTSGSLTVNGGTLNMAGQSLTVGNLTGTGGVISGTANNRTLTIGQGDNGGGDFQGVIANGSGGTTALTKTGVGTITLSGPNTYTGATAINAGTLIINGNQNTASGNVTCAANATLGGTGTLGGNTTIAANGRLEFDLSTPTASHDALDLAATRTLTFSGASVLTITSSGEASPGTYTLVTAPGGITGAAPATLNLPIDWEATTEISGNSLVLNVTSTGGPAPVASFAIAGVPSQVTVGTAITGITLTALDEFGETATSFVGTVTFGGTAGITGTSANFVNGVRSGVSITPMVLGNDLTLTVDDGSGHTGSRVFNVVSAPYDDWSTASGLIGEDAAPAAILQPDGLTNFEKFAFGMNPTVANFRPLEFVADGELTAPGAPTIGNFAPPGNPDDERAVFTRRKDHAAAGLIYTVHFSADLKQWTASAALPAVITDPNSIGDHEVVSVPFSDTVPVEGGGLPQPPKFMRVTITME